MFPLNRSSKNVRVLDWLKLHHAPVMLEMFYFNLQLNRMYHQFKGNAFKLFSGIEAVSCYCLS